MPGDRIGLAEEYVKGEGVYEENGELFAAIAGILVIEDRIASVRTAKTIPVIKKGDVVLGRVVDVRNNMALVEVARKKGVERELVRRSTGVLHISNVAEQYVENMIAAVGYLDVIKARVVDDSLRLSTKEVEMGVVKALCSSCRHELVLEGDTLKCPRCGSVEKRKLSPDYGRGEW